MSFPRYKNYKDSGVEWLGEVPEHWGVKRFKQVFKERDERSEFGTEILLSVSAYTGVSPRSEIVDDGDYLSRADSLEGYKICHPNDLVMNIMLAWNRGLAFSTYAGIVSPAYCVFRVIDGSLPRFLNYLVRTDLYTLYFKAFSSGVIDSRLRLYPDAFASLFCVLPSFEEQQIIATFLDRETAKIDALVAEQQRLIGLLKEKRQAVISHTITKGLNPDAPMKDSGIEWLSEVPEHWKVTAFRRVACIEEGQVSPTDEYFSDWVLVAPNHIESGTGRILFLETAAEQAAISGKYRVRVGEVIYSKIRPALNKVCLSEINCLCSADMYPIRVLNGLSANYLVYLMLSQSFVKLMVNESMRVAMPKVNRDTLYGCRVAIPPLEEQEVAVLHIKAEAEKYDTLAAEAHAAITLLQERRKALISAAVTGKIDVRGLAATQPEREVAA